jgi:hypothetical protein
MAAHRKDNQALTVETWPLERLTANPENYRSHPDAQLEHLQQSLREFGWYKNVVVTPQGVVLAGHGIIAAAKAEGLAAVPVHVFRGTEAEARKLMVADNEASRLAEDDGEQLSQLLAAIAADSESGLVGTGHDDASLAALLETLAEAVAPIGFPPLPDGDRAPFQQMTFTLSDLQAQDVKAAVDAAKDAGPFVETGNENSNGNALARICEEYLSWAERKTS